MKKLILTLCSLLCLALVLNLSACGGKDDQSSAPSPSPSPAASATPKPTASPKPTGTPKPTATPKPTDTPTPQPTEAPTPTPEPVQDEDPDYDPNEGGEVFVQPSGDDDEPSDNNGGGDDTPSVPYNLIGSSVDALYGAYGYPNSSEYGPSCIGPGQDGVLYYSGFTVYTYSENGVETIQDVA